LLTRCAPGKTGELGLAVPDVGDEFPVEEVFGGVDGEAGEGDEGGGGAEEGGR